MLNNWLKPPPVVPIDHYAPHTVAHLLKQPPDTLKKVQVALVGVQEKAANTVRTHLWGTANAFEANSVADLGNLRKADANYLMPVLYELLSSGIVPILIGGNDEHGKAQFLAYQELKNLLHVGIVDQLPRFGEHTAGHAEVYHSLLYPRHPLLFQLTLLGLQAHQLPPATVQWLNKEQVEWMRLGRSRTSLEDTEPLLRDLDMLAFHLGAIRASDAPAVANASPSGYLTEEACQLARYAGMSDKVTSFGVYGFQPNLDSNGHTAQVVSQLVWYFLDGYFNRKGDFPLSTRHLTEYVVELPQYQYHLTFWKSTKSGRWWFQVPTPVKRKQQRHRLVACSYQDYQAACREELPERLVAAMQRFA